jgi:tetratricopeptide (TPR) repeat protein
MRHFIWLTFLIFGLNLGLAQNSYQAQVSRVMQDTIDERTKVDILLDLYSASIFSNLDTAFYIVQNIEALNTNYAKGQALNSYALYYKMRNDYFKALRFYQQAFEHFSNENDAEGKASALTGIAYVKGKKMQRYSEALENLQQALDIFIDLNQSQSISTTYSNIASVYQKLGDFEKALENHRNSLDYLLPRGNPLLIATAHNNIAGAYKRLNNLRLAKANYLRAFKLSELHQNDLIKATAANGYASVLILNNEFEEAKEYLDISLALSQRMNLKENKVQIYKNYSNYYKAINNWKKASEFIEKHYTLSDSLDNENILSEIFALQSQFETLEKDKEIELLQKEKALNQAKIKRQNTLVLTSIVIGVLLIGFVILLIINSRKKAEANRLLKERNQLIEKNKAQIELINLQLSDENIAAKYESLKNQVNPHFLFNSLNVLAQLIEDDAEKASEFINKFSKLYKDILQSKDNGLNTVKQELDTLEAYLYLIKIRFEDKFQVEIEQKNMNLNLFLPSLSLQMLVENAVKHNKLSFGSPLKIKIYQTTDNFIVIQNNIQLRNTKAEGTGIGLENLKQRFKYYTNKPFSFSKIENLFEVKLPLLNPIVENNTI